MTKDNKFFLFLFLFVFFSYSFFLSSGFFKTYDRQILLVWSLTDEGKLNIDKYAGKTHDISLYKGHSYIAGEPGLSFAAVPFYFSFKTASRFFGMDTPSIQIHSVYVARIFVVSLPSALLAVVLYVLLPYFCPERKHALSLALLYAAASPALVYSTLFYRHHLTAAVSLYIFYLIFMMKKEGFQNRRVFLTGLLMSFVFFCDNVAFVLLFLLFVYLCINLDTRGRIFYLFLGTLPFLICFFGYNYVCFDNIVKSGFSYTPFALKGETGMNLMELFISRLKYPPRAFYDVTFSPYRGIFYYFPLSLLAFLSVGCLKERKDLRQEIVLLLSIILFYIYCVSTFTDWRGGAFGSMTRYLVLILPFFVPLIGLVADKFKVLFYSFACVSFLISVVITISLGGEAPNAIQFPVSFSLATARHGFFRYNILNALGVPGTASVILYFLFLAAGAFFLVRGEKKLDAS